MIITMIIINIQL